MLGFFQVAAEDKNLAALNAPRAGNKTEEGGLSSAIGPDDPDNFSGRNLKVDVIKRDNSAITVRDRFDAGNYGLVGAHRLSDPRSRSGQLTCSPEMPAFRS
jgi:hypothetical protein